MKRCPHCEFIYPDGDNVCDFDQTPLLGATESEIAAITNTPERPVLADLAATQSKKFQNRRSRRGLSMAVGLGLLLGILIFGFYSMTLRQLSAGPMPEQQANSLTAPVVVPPAPSPSPSPFIAHITSSGLVASPVQPSPGSAKTTTAHSSARLAPVSKGSPGTNANPNHKPVIVLTSGGKVEADAVWQARDGIWYRRGGIVTLLKKNRVKAILNQSQ